MPIVQSFGALQAKTEPRPIAWPAASTVQMYGLSQAYAEIYRTQPNVRICVDFLARNVAQLAPHIYRKLSATDRLRLNDHELAGWLTKPNPSTTRYRLFETLMGDLGIYFNAYWLKVPYTLTTGRPAIGLVRLPPEEVSVEGGLLPRTIVWYPPMSGRPHQYAPSDIVRFDGYNPTNPLMGLSPLETLRRILAEEAAAGEHRESYWRNAARIEGVVTRPKDKPRYTPTQVQQWREQWQATYAGGGQAGKTVLLQDGEDWKPSAFSARESEFTAGGKLRREICAAAYHIPQPFVGIMEHATFSNIVEQHKNLYQDTLAPWLEMITEELEAQLLSECQDQEDVYIEFNIDAKLAGTLIEQTDAIRTSVGRPWRTVNEARALQNLPRDPDPDSDRIAPQQGGPSEATARQRPAAPPAAPVDRDETEDDEDDEDEDDQARAIAAVVAATRARQLVRLAKLPAVERPQAFFADLDRWQRELADDLTPIVGAAAASLATDTNVATLTALLQEGS